MFMSKIIFLNEESLSRSNANFGLVGINQNDYFTEPYISLADVLQNIQEEMNNVAGSMAEAPETDHDLQVRWNTLRDIREMISRQ